MAGEILPSVALLRLATGETGEELLSAGAHSSQGEGKGTLACGQESSSVPLENLCRIPEGLASQPGGEEGIDPKRIIGDEMVFDKKDLPGRRGHHPSREEKAVVGMAERYCRNSLPGRLDLDVFSAFELDPEAPVVGNDEPQVLDAGDIDPGRVDLGDDSLGEGEPKAGRSKGSPYHLLGGRTPDRPGSPGFRSLHERHSPTRLSPSFRGAKAPNLWIIGASPTRLTAYGSSESVREPSPFLRNPPKE